MLKQNWLLINSICCLICLVVGCSKGDGDYRELDDNDNVTNTAPPEHHDHGPTGPHGGHILEFGDYHGEITVADGIVSVYILGGDVKTAEPVAEASAVVKLEIGDKTEELKLTASPQEGETDGKSSLFVSSTDDTPESIKDIEDIHGSVVLSVVEKKMNAEVSHDHGHDDHHDH